MRCLKCDRKFKSRGKDNRMCGNCRETNRGRGIERVTTGGRVVKIQRGLK